MSKLGALQWRHNERDGISNHQPHDCLLRQPFFSGADQRKHWSSALLAFVRRIHRSPVNFPHKGSVTRKMLPFDDVIVESDGLWENGMSVYVLLYFIWRICCGWYIFHIDIETNHAGLKWWQILYFTYNSAIAIVRIWFRITLCTWWRHHMEIFSALLDLCAGNLSVTGEFPAQRAVSRSFDIFFGVRLNKRLNKQSWGWWFEPLHSL